MRYFQTTGSAKTFKPSTERPRYCLMEVGTLLMHDRITYQEFDQIADLPVGGSMTFFEETSSQFAIVRVE